MTASEVLSSSKDKKASNVFTRDEKQKDVRRQNILAARAVSDAVRTSLGPKGMDKMIHDSKGGVLITNDGATILKEMSVLHPTAKMLVELSRAQDVEAGDGTTTVVILAGSMLQNAQTLLDKNIHPQMISKYFLEAAKQAESILESMSISVDLNDRNLLIKLASTSLQSKVVSSSSAVLAPIAVDAVLTLAKTSANSITGEYNENIDLHDIRIVKKIGDTVDDSEFVDGLILAQQRVTRKNNGPSLINNAKIGLIQFCLSTPKTDMENNIVIKDYTQMDKLIKQERILLAKAIKQIAETGCNVLLIQKSILRDAVNDLSLDYLSKAKIMVVRDIERDEIDFISKTLKCTPIASLDHFTSDKLGHAKIVTDEVTSAGAHIIRFTGVPTQNTVSILLRASNNLMLDEAERSLHDALCVVRSLVKRRSLLPGGGAPEAELSYRLSDWSRRLKGVGQLICKYYSECFDIIPYTLAENTGLNPLEICSILRSKHAGGDSTMGINMKKGTVDKMINENVLQPLLVTLSAVKLATETVMMILKIDDILLSR